MTGVEFAGEKMEVDTSAAQGEPLQHPSEEFADPTSDYENEQERAAYWANIEAERLKREAEVNTLADKEQEEFAKAAETAGVTVVDAPLATGVSISHTSVSSGSGPELRPVRKHKRAAAAQTPQTQPNTALRVTSPPLSISMGI